MLLDSGLADQERLGYASVGLAFRHRLEHISLPRAEPFDRPVALAAAKHTRDDLGVERGASSSDACDRIDEGLHVTHALLQQVADSLGAITDELERIALVIELREQQHAGVRTLTSYLNGRPQTVVAVTRRHVDVGDDDRGLVGKALAQKIRGVAGLSGDLEPGLDEQPGNPLAQQHVILADHDPQRSGHRPTVALCGSMLSLRSEQAGEWSVRKVGLGYERTRTAAPDLLGAAGVAVDRGEDDMRLPREGRELAGE